MHVSERRACAALGQHRSTQRKVPRGREDAERLTAYVIELARQYGRYGYRKIAALLRDAGWLVSETRVERVWQREGLKVPQKQPKRGRLWLTNGSCIRLRPEHSNHVWSYDFVEDRTHDGRKYRMLNAIDEFTHESLAIRIKPQGYWHPSPRAFVGQRPGNQWRRLLVRARFSCGSTMKVDCNMGTGYISQQFISSNAPANCFELSLSVAKCAGGA